MSMDGRIALVTGASRGIGRAIALELARRGAFVAVHYARGADAAAAVLDEIRGAGGAGATVQADLGEADAPLALSQRFLAIATERAGAPVFDILVNNAGISKRATIEDIDEADFDAIHAVNLRAPFFLIKALAPCLREGGRIINVSSMGTRAAYPAMAAYAPAKAGLEALTLLLAPHYGPRGITVNAVRPGATATDMNPVGRDPEARAATAAQIALGRVGEPDDIAGIVAFLASREGGWITGQCIDASGGQRI